jgi:hypothetical protein
MAAEVNLRNQIDAGMKHVYNNDWHRFGRHPSLRYGRRSSQNPWTQYLRKDRHVVFKCTKNAWKTARIRKHFGANADHYIPKGIGVSLQGLAVLPGG